MPQGHKTPLWKHICVNGQQRADYQTFYTDGPHGHNPLYDLYATYHDTQWGVPCHDERTLFEFLVLEGAQAGLSWITILRKRENYRRAFDGFDAEKIARYGEKDTARLLGDAGIVRNKLKIAATIANARATLALYQSGGNLNDLFWQFVDGQPVVNHWNRLDQVPVFTPAAAALSKELKQRGFRFVGPTVIYAHMQATGMVNDHLVTCPRHAACQFPII